MKGSVVATRMRAGAPDDGARAPRPMFTGHAAAIVGVCLRGGQRTFFQTIIARHASAARGPRRPPHRCGWACRGRSCSRVRTARRPGSAVGALRFRAKNDRLVSCRAKWPFRAKKQQVSEFCPIFPEQNWALAHNKQCARYKTYIVLASRCPGGTYATITLYEQHLLHTQCLKTLIFLSC